MSNHRKHSIDLGLAVLSAVTPAGVSRTLADIADCCECSCQMIWQIEHRAMRKIRKRLFMQRDPVLAELLQWVRPDFVNGIEEPVADANPVPPRYRLARAAFARRAA
jgi:hypothetical protein